jgi:hypothetical protein
MNHSAARRIFEEIRNRPYAWSIAPGESAHNCYFKGVELLQRLGILGYAVRGRVGETYLDERVPEEIKKLYPPEVLLTHFWVEVQLDGTWQPVMIESYSPSSRDFRSSIIKMKNLKVDTVLLIGWDESGFFVRQSEDLGFTLLLWYTVPCCLGYGRYL